MGHKKLRLYGRLEKTSFVVEERIRSFEVSDRHQMGHDGAETLVRLIRKPGVQMKRRRFERERWGQTRVEIERNGVGGRNAGECRQRGAVNVAGSDQSRALMSTQDGGETVGIAQALHVHVADAGGNRRASTLAQTTWWILRRIIPT